VWPAGRGLGRRQVGSILAEILGLPVITLACSIEAVDKKLKVKRMVKDGFEVLEAPMPSLVTVSRRSVFLVFPVDGLMLARKKQIPVWKAQDIGLSPRSWTRLTPYRGHQSLCADPKDRV